MRSQSSGHFYGRLHNKKRYSSLSGQIELTYRCNLDCIHCYCKGSEGKDQELSAEEWKKILDTIHKQSTIWLVITGGDPLIRDDFLEIYSYAKAKGFIITIFTNGQAFTEQIIDYLVKSPPYSIEITLNGITKHTYESITQTSGSFFKVMQNINILAKKKLPLILKANCLKQNKHEIGKIKAFTEGLLGKWSDNKFYFKFGELVSPRLNGDKTPTNHRLSFEELLEVKRQDIDIWREYQKRLHYDVVALRRDRNFLYRCNSWKNYFFINPYGRLKFCEYSDRFSVDLKTTAFKEGFFKIFPRLLKQRFKTSSKCRDCHLRPICYYCPARAYLETGDEEAPVDYFCQLAEETVRQMQNTAKTKSFEPQLIKINK